MQSEVHTVTPEPSVSDTSDKRGVVCRANGGGQERVIAKRYNDYAETVQSKWHRTANMLRGIAKTYEREAKHYDERDAFEEFE